MNPAWTVRVGLARDGSAGVRSRCHSFTVGQSVDFGASTPGTSAVEALLGSLGADILLGFCGLCERRRLPVDRAEARVSGSLDNALVAVGVFGEEGEPRLKEAQVTLSILSPASEAELRAAWDAALSRSPLVATLSRAANLSLDLQLL